MQMVVMGIPAEMKDKPGLYEVNVIEVGEDRLVFELADPKQAEYARHWNAAVPVIRGVQDRLESIVNAMDACGAQQTKMLRSEIQSFINDLNIACP